MIRILLVEPMNLLRGTLAATLSLEDDFEVVADLGTLDQALDMARAVPPDVAVVNVRCWPATAWPRSPGSPRSNPAAPP